jgi:hypothetical protein
MRPSSAAAAMPSAVRSGFPVACLLAVAVALFMPALKGYWLGDDFDWVQQFYQYPWRDIPRLFVGDWSRAIAQEYRPLWAISFVIDLRLWGLNPLALHVTNLALHLAVGVLVWYLTATMPGANKLAAPLALAFFVLAPTHAEPVAWIAARGHILAPIFILGTLILLRRFEQGGSWPTYLASFGCALAAFATEEDAVALPPLLLARDLVDAPRLDRQWLRRTTIIHAPFWALLVGYLGFRYIIFGMLARPDTPSSIPTLIRNEYLVLVNLWLSPYGAIGRIAIPLLASALLLTPFLILAGRGRRSFTRELIFSAVLWPLICTTVLFGARGQRHLYLASIGVAVAFGLAGSLLLASRRLVAGVGLTIIGLLLAIFGVGLRTSIAQYARNGYLSSALAQEVDRAIEHAMPDGRALIVIIPEFPERQVIFWDYFYPVALNPPFRSTPAPPRILPSFASCHCEPAQWKASHAAGLALLSSGMASAIHVVLWDTRKSAFVTRVLSQSEFWQAGYAAPDGPLVRPRRPGLPAPILPGPNLLCADELPDSRLGRSLRSLGAPPMRRPIGHGRALEALETSASPFESLPPAPAIAEVLAGGLYLLRPMEDLC